MYSQGMRPALRSDAMNIKYAHLSMSSNRIVKGVTGLSVVSLIPNFSILHSLPPDYMQACLEDVGKLFVTE